MAASEPFVTATLAPPDYSRAALQHLLPGVVAALGSGLDPGATTDDAALPIEAVRRACVLLVDGLGWELLLRHPAEAPFLHSLIGANTGPLVCGFPATTATSLTSLGTGLSPGRHGVTGLEMLVPDTDQVLSALRWDLAVDPYAWQPHVTWFERAAQAGIRVTRVQPRAFRGTGLTEAALRGGDFSAAESPGERVADTIAALRSSTPSLVYCYYGDLDSTGHRRGCDSQAWRLQLAHVDRLAEQIATALPSDAMLLVTADHGMLDVPASARTDLASTPELDAGIRALAGEPRARYLHTLPGAETDVRHAWQEYFGASMLVLEREEAVADGWFGDVVEPRVLARIGDVVAIAQAPRSVVDSRRMKPTFVALVGQHGSATSAEVLVPLLQFRAP